MLLHFQINPAYTLPATFFLWFLGQCLQFNDQLVNAYPDKGEGGDFIRRVVTGCSKPAKYPQDFKNITHCLPLEQVGNLYCIRRNYTAILLKRK